MRSWAEDLQTYRATRGSQAMAALPEHTQPYRFASVLSFMGRLQVMLCLLHSALAAELWYCQCPYCYVTGTQCVCDSA